MRTLIPLLLLSLLAGCGSRASIGLVIPPGNASSLVIDTGGGRLDVRNNGPGAVAVSGSQDLGRLPSAEMNAGSSITWYLQSQAALEVRNISDRPAEVRITAFNARGIAVQRPAQPAR
jgi:hypothetical protein